MHELTRKLLTIKQMAFGSEISLLGERVVICGADYFTILTKRMEAGQLYDISREAVKSFAESSELMEDMDGEKRARLLQKISSSAGWGKIEAKNIEVDSAEAEIHVHGSAITQDMDEKGKKDHVLRGMITGASEEISGKKLVGIETKCIADGDEKCVIKIKPEENFDPETLEKYSDQLP